MIEHLDSVFINIQMELNMKATGLMIFRADTVKKNGMTDRIFKVNIKEERNKALVFSLNNVGMYLWGDGSSFEGEWHENSLNGWVNINF